MFVTKAFKMDFCAQLIATFLFLRCLCGITSAERFIIRQQANKIGDVFKFSSKLKCGKDFCSRYKATSISQSNNCTCECKTKPNLTFSLTDRKWKCSDDTVIRAKEGCSIFMETNNLQSNLLTLSDGHKKELSIYSFSNPPNTCYISHETSYYLTCNGTWEKIGQSVFQRFFLLPSDKAPWKMEIKVKITTPATKYLNGRVIKIGFTSTCTLTSSTGTTSTQLCLLFKLKGNRTCDAPFTKVKPVKPDKPVLLSSITPSVSESSRVRKSTSSISVESVERSQLQTTSSLRVTSSSSKWISTTTFSQLGKEKTLTTLESSESRNDNQNRRGTRTMQKKSLGDETIIILAGIVSAAATMIILIIAIAVVVNRRKSRTIAVSRECATDEDGYIVPCDGWKAKEVNKGKTDISNTKVVNNLGIGGYHPPGNINLRYNGSNENLWAYASRQTEGIDSQRRNTGLVYDYALPEMPVRNIRGLYRNKNYDRKEYNRPKSKPLPYTRNIQERKTDSVYCDVESLQGENSAKSHQLDSKINKSTYENTARNRNAQGFVGERSNKDDMYIYLEKSNVSRVTESEELDENETEI